MRIWNNESYYGYYSRIASPLAVGVPIRAYVFTDHLGDSEISPIHTALRARTLSPTHTSWICDSTRSVIYESGYCCLSDDPANSSYITFTHNPSSAITSCLRRVALCNLSSGFYGDYPCGKPEFYYFRLFVCQHLNWNSLNRVLPQHPSFILLNYSILSYCIKKDLLSMG